MQHGRALQAFHAVTKQAPYCCAVLLSLFGLMFISYHLATSHHQRSDDIDLTQLHLHAAGVRKSVLKDTFEETAVKGAVLSDDANDGGLVRLVQLGSPVGMYSTEPTKKETQKTNQTRFGTFL